MWISRRAIIAVSCSKISSASTGDQPKKAHTISNVPAFGWFPKVRLRRIMSEQAQLAAILDHHRMPLPSANWLGTVYHGMSAGLLRPILLFLAGSPEIRTGMRSASRKRSSRSCGWQPRSRGPNSLLQGAAASPIVQARRRAHAPLVVQGNLASLVRRALIRFLVLRGIAQAVAQPAPEISPAIDDSGFGYSAFQASPYGACAMAPLAPTAVSRPGLTLVD